MKTMLIFGATSAIAEAVIHQFANENISLYLVARQAAKLQALASDLSIRYPHLHIHTKTAELGNPRQNTIIVQQIIAELTTIDIVFIAYGSLDNQKHCEASYELTEAALTINFLSVIALLTPIASLLEKQRHGVIAVITSVAGDRGRQSNYVYGTAKGALNIFLQGLRHRLHKSHVHVLTIKPGLIHSPMTKHMKKNMLWAEPATIAKQIKKAIDRKRHIIYVPHFWLIIMKIINWIPERWFKKLAL